MNQFKQMKIVCLYVVVVNFWNSLPQKDVETNSISRVRNGLEKFMDTLPTHGQQVHAPTAWTKKVPEALGKQIQVDTRPKQRNTL